LLRKTRDRSRYLTKFYYFDLIVLLLQSNQRQILCADFTISYEYETVHLLLCQPMS